MLHLLAEGKSHAELGEALGVSPRAVGKHMELLYRNLGVNNRTAAVLARMKQPRKGAEARSTRRGEAKTPQEKKNARSA